jgi:hypothetical protein
MPRATLAIASIGLDCLSLEGSWGLRGRIFCRYSLERVGHNGGTAGLARDGRGAVGSGLARPRVVVPAMGATFIAGLEGMAGDHSLASFAVGWKSWWIKDAAGLLLSAPWWTLHSREATIENPVRASVAANLVHTSAAEDLLNLAHAISAFETSSPKETPVHRTE